MTDSNTDWDQDKAYKRFEEEYNKSKQKQQIEKKRPNILVVGLTGNGKTTLCQKIFGEDIVPKEEIGRKFKPQTQNFTRYTNDSICIWDSRGYELHENLSSFKKDLRAFIDKTNSQPNIDDHIHLIWLTVLGPMARLSEEVEGELFNDILDPTRTILVITKSDKLDEEEEEGIRKRATVGIEEEPGLGIPENQVFFVSKKDDDSDNSGVMKLIRRSHELLPEAYKAAFVEAQIRDVGMKRKQILDKNAKAKALIVAAGAAAATVCAAPIPIASGTILVPTQIGLIASLAALYDVGSGAALKQSALPLVARVAGMWAASELSKLIPGLGSVISATVGSSLTVALGWYVQKQFEAIALAKAEGREPPEPFFDWNEFLNFRKNFRQ